MSSKPEGGDQPPGIEAFCAAREPVDAATTILTHLITEDRLYLMPKRESHKLLVHTRNLLQLATLALEEGCPGHDEEVEHHGN